MPTTARTPAISLRPEGPDDSGFRFALYSSVRKEELDSVGWPAEMRSRFLEMQFKTLDGYYREFPHAEFVIIMVEGQRAGRFILNRAPDEFRLVDIALLTEYRHTGIGTALIRRLQHEAAAAGKPLRLTVQKNHRAGRLYQRLGFTKTGESEVHDEMEWRFHGPERLPDSHHETKP